MKSIKKKLESLGYVSHEKSLEETYGKIGTKERDQYEKELKMELIGEFLRKIRKERNLTQEDLAHIMGTHKTYVSKIENNFKDHKFTTIKKYIEALNVSKMSLKLELEDGKSKELQLI